MSTSTKKWNVFFIAMGLLALFIFNYWFNEFLRVYNYVNSEVNKANVDFHVYYSAGRTYLNGGNPYDPMYSTDGFSVSPYLYPPTLVPLYALLGKLNYETARHIFLIFYLIIFGVTLWFLAKSSLPDDRLATYLLGLVLLVLSAPFISMVMLGQIALLVSCSIFVSLLLYMNKHHNLSAFFLVLAVLLKVNPIILLATFVLFFQDWKYLFRFSVILTLIILASLFLIKPDWYWIYLIRVLPQLTGTPQADYMNQTPLRWVVNNDIPFFPNIDKTMLMRVYSIGGMLAFSSFSLWMGIRHRGVVVAIRSGSANLDERFIGISFFILNICMVMLLSARVWSHTYVWFILPLIPMLIYSFRKTQFWFVIAIGLGVFGVNSQILNQPNVLNYLNILGAVILALCVFILLLFPKTILPEFQQKIDAP